MTTLVRNPNRREDPFTLGQRLNVYLPIVSEMGLRTFVKDAIQLTAARIAFVKEGPDFDTLGEVIELLMEARVKLEKVELNRVPKC